MQLDFQQVKEWCWITDIEREFHIYYLSYIFSYNKVKLVETKHWTIPCKWVRKANFHSTFNTSQNVQVYSDSVIKLIHIYLIPNKICAPLNFAPLTLPWRGAILHHPPNFQFYTSKIFFESLNNLRLLSASYYA